MAAMRFQFWPALVVCVGPFAAQAALPSNPMDPSLPLSIHARVQCLSSNPAVITGTEQAGCQEGSVTADRAASIGEAHSDLRTGELRTTATSQVQPQTSGLLPGAGYAEAQLYDTLTVNGPVTTGFQVNLSMTVSGLYSSSSANPRPLDTFVTANLITLSGATGFVDDAAGIGIKIYQDGIGQLTGQLGDVTTNADPTSLQFDTADMRFTLTSSFFVTAQNPSFAFYARLLVNNFSSFQSDDISTRETVLDFGHTAKLSIDAPAGITFSSDSGAFLVPVPEPSSTALLALGLAMLVAAAARPRAARQ